jgi:hypothetical protein
MAIDFPDSPSVGDQYVASGKTYQWDGTVWTIYGPQTNPNILKVDTTNNRVGINKTSPTTALDVNGDATAGKFLASGSEANLMPSGTTAERPSSPTAGMFRFNETTGEPEWYSTSVGWVKFRDGLSFTVSYLVVAGGGGGQPTSGGGAGGGAGGYRSSVSGESSGGGGVSETPVTASLLTSYTVTVGAGGAGTSNGSDSTFDSITSVGGGGTGNADGSSGGSGGGASNTNGSTPSAQGGAGTSGQGFAGGATWSGSTTNDNNNSAGGGGGAGAVGATATSGQGGNGGIGVQSSITGTGVYRAGGGGGGTRASGSGGAGGLGGGGDGVTSGVGQSGDANTGGGAGGSRATPGSTGGSGVVIVRYPSGLTPTVSAGLTSTTTTVGSDKVTVFTAGTGTVSWA